MARPSVISQRFPLKRIAVSPAQTILLGFASIMVVGGILLSLPVAAADGRPTPFIDALFTATSATAVTGLVVVDTATHWSLFGQLVILTLIQVGGFGYMTTAMLLALLVGRRIGLRERMVLAESYNLYALGGVVRFTKMVILVTLAIEGTGALLLALRWVPEVGLPRGIYWGLFHAISAFNNAGFDVMGNNFASLTRYVTDLPVNLIVAALIILGGLGFGVLVNLRDGLRRLTLHSKIVLSTSLGLILIGTLGIFLFESTNPGTLGPLGWPGKALAAFFQSVTPRTAGFNTVQIGKMHDASLMLLVILMFIGASPGGTGGGIKTTTFMAPLAVILAQLRGYPEPALFKRRLPSVVIYKAVTIALLGLAFVVTMSILLTVTEGVSFMAALFEVASGFGTVGLSTGITPSLSTLGKVIIMVTVYTGRAGLLTLAFALTRRQMVPRFRYPEEPIYVG
jgi:trk system potassium uptake protein TrkH